MYVHFTKIVLFISHWFSISFTTQAGKGHRCRRRTREGTLAIVGADRPRTQSDSPRGEDMKLRLRAIRGGLAIAIFVGITGGWTQGDVGFGALCFILTGGVVIPLAVVLDGPGEIRGALEVLRKGLEKLSRD